jgi:hypothetical protein
VPGHGPAANVAHNNKPGLCEVVPTDHWQATLDVKMPRKQHECC